MAILPGAGSWSPFKIDALGIVTLLGADALRKSTARLVPNPFAEYLPLLASHIFADNSVGENLPGFTLYNVTDGIKATDLSSWFSRWLSCQQFGWQETTLHIEDAKKSRRKSRIWYISVGFACLLNCFFIVFPSILGDWYGFASATGLVITILVRTYVLYASRRSLDNLVEQADKESTDSVKLIITLPNGKIVSVRTTRGITVKCLLTEAQPENRKLHLLARAINWVSFAVHAVTLGMASLCIQLILVVSILVASVLTIQQVGCDESLVGRRLEIKRHDDVKINRRAKAYCKLELNTQEEESMTKWDLFPSESNKIWWERYRILQANEVVPSLPRANTQWDMTKGHV
jgi:hypothetical protein